MKVIYLPNIHNNVRREEKLNFSRFKKENIEFSNVNMKMN